MGRISAALLVIFLAVILTMACSGGSPTLQLGTGPISEDEFLLQIRQNVMARPDVMRRICDDLSELPDVEAIATFTAANYMANGTPVASPDPDGEARAASILRAECDRLMG